MRYRKGKGGRGGRYHGGRKILGDKEEEMGHLGRLQKYTDVYTHIHVYVSALLTEEGRRRQSARVTHEYNKTAISPVICTRRRTSDHVTQVFCYAKVLVAKIDKLGVWEGRGEGVVLKR